MAKRTRKTAKKKAAPKRRRAAAKKPTAKKRDKKMPRTYYGGIDKAEKIFAVWLQTGTIKGTLRKLRMMEEFDSIAENTLRSIFAEHREDWLRRKEEIDRAVAKESREKLAEEMALLEVEVQRTHMKGLIELAKVSSDMMPKALRALAAKIEDGDLKAPDLAYSLPKIVKELHNILGLGRKSQSPVPTVDARSVHVHTHIDSPKERAAKGTKADLVRDIERESRELDARRI